MEAKSFLKLGGESGQPRKHPADTFYLCYFFCSTNYPECNTSNLLISRLRSPCVASLALRLPLHATCLEEKLVGGNLVSNPHTLFNRAKFLGCLKSGQYKKMSLHLMNDLYAHPTMYTYPPGIP